MIMITISTITILILLVIILVCECGQPHTDCLQTVKQLAFAALTRILELLWRVHCTRISYDA